jgi:hypothetical protein
MSFAAYRVLSKLFPEQQSSIDKLMEELGYDFNNKSKNTNSWLLKI